MSLDVLLELEKRKHFRWLLKDSASRGLGLMTMILVLYVGFAESIGSSETWHQIDKIMHFMIFGGFAFMFLQYARFKLFVKIRTGVRLSMLFSFLAVVAIMSELSHLFIPHRTFEWNDMIANLAGIFTIGIPVVLITPFRRNTNQLMSFQDSNHFKQGGQQSLRIRRRARHG